VDGVSGIELLMVVLDVSATPIPPVPGAVDPPPPIPGPISRLTDAVFDRWAFVMDRFLDSQSAFADFAAADDTRSRAIRRALEAGLPIIRTPMERAPFNQPLTEGRKVAVTEFSFAEIRAIRAACGGTVNDVVLAVLGGALGRYIEMHGQSTDNRIVRIMTPVNVRRESERGALGNRVSMLLVKVPVGIHDPVERLNAITRMTDDLKRAGVADGFEMIYDFFSAGPPMLQALAGRMSPPPNTLANMVCTNVPGPMIPLYTVGHRMLAHYPLVPIAFEMGIGCGVTSYDQKLYFGLMADAEAAPDVDRLREFLDQAFVELRSAAGVAKSDIPQFGGSASEPAPSRRSGAQPQALAADAG
jgi:WS/DGAT/MGAT family acyltransferase